MPKTLKFDPCRFGEVAPDILFVTAMTRKQGPAQRIFCTSSVSARLALNTLSAGAVKTPYREWRERRL